MAQETDEHKAWREAFERKLQRHQSVTTIATQLVIDVPEFSPRECWNRAAEFIDLMQGEVPQPEEEPVQFDEEPPSTRPELKLAPNPTPPRPGQGNMAGFLPTNPGPRSQGFQRFNPR
jgi:hypothetical protein